MTPNRITATYKIITPMFIGDANQTADDGIRPPSVKGALRFWWRALNWGRIRQYAESDETALIALHEEEALLFGSGNANYDNEAREKQGKAKIGQARFLLKVILTNKKITTPTLAGTGLLYLLGQGLYDHRQGILREAITQGDVKIRCILHPTLTTTQREQLEQTLLVFGLLGGLGSRARKGFGSLAITHSSSEKYPAPRNQEELITVLRQIKQENVGINEPPFTAFSQLTRIDLSLFGDNGLDLLEKAGSEQQLYRSWGRANYAGRHVVGRQNAEQNFKQSHDLMSDVGGGISPTTIPDKAVFGLPQNYFFSSTQQNIEFSVKENKQSRRASPLLLHVHQFPTGKYVLIHSLLSAVFLNEKTQLEFKTQHHRPFYLNYHDHMTDWSIIERYLNRAAFIHGETI